MKLCPTKSHAGTSLPELMVSVLLVAGFFATIFEVNAVCLRYIDATKENVAAMQGVQDRLETIRSLSFNDLKTASFMTTLLTSPSNTSAVAVKAVEHVTLSDYSSGSPSVTYTRAPGASVAPTVSWSGGSSFPSTTTLVKVNVKYSWTFTLGGRSRVEEIETIVSNGTKK